MWLTRVKKLNKKINCLEVSDEECDYINTLISVIDNSNDVVTFLHNTQSKSIADKVLTNGFEFQGHIDYTTDTVSANDIVQ